MAPPREMSKETLKDAGPASSDLFKMGVRIPQILNYGSRKLNGTLRSQESTNEFYYVIA